MPKIPILTQNFVALQGGGVVAKGMGNWKSFSRGVRSLPALGVNWNFENIARRRRKNGVSGREYKVNKGTGGYAGRGDGKFMITSISIYPIPVHVGVQNFNLPQHSSANFNLLGWGFELPSFNLPSTNFNLPGWWFELSTGSFNLPPRISIYPVGDLNFNLPDWWSKLHFTQIQFTPWIRLSKPNCSNIDWVNWNSP